MEKKKIIIPNLSLKENDFSNAMKKISSSIKEQKEISTKIEGQYITNLKYEINSILQSKLSNKEKLIQLIEKKSRIEKDRIDEKFGDRKSTIDNKALPLLKIEIDNLKELIRINVDSQTNEKNVEVTKINESEINSASIQINSDSDELIIPYKKIIAKTSKKEIEKYFYKLAKNKNPINGKPFLNLSLVDELLAQTIDVFENTKRKHQLFDLNVNGKQVGLIYTFVYKFYQLNEKQLGGTKQTYAEFLKMNFSNFSALDTKNIYGRLRIYDDATEKYSWL